MANHKRRKVLSAIVEDTLNSEEDEIGLDSMGIDSIIEDQETIQNLARRDTNSTAIYALGETIRNTLLEINEIREQNRERRHKELLDTLNQIIKSEADDGGTKKAGRRESEIETDIQHSDLDEDSTLCYIVVDGENACKDDSGPTINEIMYDEKTSYTTEMLKMKREGSTPKQTKKITQTTICRKPLKSEEDLKAMRAQMLEMHRRKMEDRENKKRACLQVEHF